MKPIDSSGNATLAGGLTVGGLSDGFLHADKTGKLFTVQIDLGKGITSTLGVGNGGAGQTSLTQYGVLYGNGTSGISAITPGTSGYLLQSNGSGTAPSWVAANGLSAGSVGFSGVTGGANTTAAMLVGSGASLGFTGTGTINASSLLGNTWAVPGTIGSTTANTGSFTALTSNGALSLKDLTATSQYGYSNYAGRKMEITDGTVASPVTTAGSTFKVSRTEFLASPGVGANIVDGEANAAIYGASVNNGASVQQVTGVIGVAKKLGTVAADATALYGFAWNDSSSGGGAAGLFTEGRRDTNLGSATGAEIHSTNWTTTPAVYNPNGNSDSIGVWSTVSGLANGGPAFAANTERRNAGRKRELHAIRSVSR